MSARGITPRYLLDTNICIYIINRKPPEVFGHFDGLSVGEIAISSITGAELTSGVAKSGSPRNQQALDKFLAPLDILAFDAMAMQQYGRLRTQLEKQGTPIGPLDTLIAAHALALGCTLVTNNLREFERVPGLSLENWAQDRS
ncbi:type II toxin-antitoxin system VapC family toxin [Zoogloea sp.]|uniref:type II toxin-antitoxin system tRNA(fMet)-specific endonuclease VapC n=1 Tax=Zoogloea sp. TaxID=49181 RepID=UPI00321FCF3B